MANRFDRTTFESTEFLVESTEAPKIKAGGSSSSNMLNRYFDALSQDIALLTTRTNIVATRANRVADILSNQSAALTSVISTLSGRIDAASGYTKVLADMHSGFYVDGDTTAELSSIYGQATLPTKSSVDLLVQEDVYGNKYVSPEIEVSYTVRNISDPALLSNNDYIVDPNGIFMLREEQAWIVPTTSTNPMWIKIKAPVQYRGLNPNVLEIWPLPAFATKLGGLYYQEAGSDDVATWHAVDISYLPSYNNTPDDRLELFGPIRVHLPNVPISNICFAIAHSGVSNLGLKSVRLIHREYDSSATLVVKDPYSRTISTTLLRGKDPSDLSTLTVTRVANKAIINMTSTNSATTPVITGVLVDVI